MRETQPGGIAKLKAHMERASGATFHSHSANQGAHPQFGLQRGWASCKGAFRSFWGQSKPASSLPTHHANQPTTSTPGVQRPTALDFEPLHLMSCLHEGETGKRLYQDNIAALKSDQKLMLFLQRRYRERRGKFKSLVSLRKVIGIHFIQVSTSTPRYKTHTHILVPCLCKRERRDSTP
jgi:hypothetical protein